MAHSATHSRKLKLYLVLNALALLSAAALMTLLATSGGFSGPRLILVGATTALALAAAALAVRLHRQPARARQLVREIQAQVPRLRIALGLIFLIFWCVTWIPPHATGDAYYYFIGLYPLILCGLLASGLALVLFVLPVGYSTTQWCKKYLQQRRPAIRVAVLALASFVFLALLTQQFRILPGSEPYWYGAGIPILATHVLIAACLAIFAAHMRTWPRARNISVDATVFVLIWIATAALWVAPPVPPSFWVTEPRAPTFEFYPFSDAVTYDLGSQFALIGQGIYNRVVFDRALYMAFLVYLHTAGGQNYQQLMAIQAAVFSVFPAILYLIGRHLHSRTAGLFFAALIALRGLTGLQASAWIDTATFKHMLTDFPTALGMAGFLILLLKWTAAPRHQTGPLLWATGILGLVSLLRPHVLVHLAGTVALVMWRGRSSWRRALGTSALALLGFMMAVLPWMTLGPSEGSLIRQYGTRLKEVIALRYPRPEPTPGPVPESIPVVPTGAAASPATAPPTPQGGPTVEEQTPPAPRLSPPADPGVPFVADHFLHNLVTSALIFPSSPQFLSVRDVVKTGEGFWQPKWDGGMSPVSAAALALSLASVAFGFGTAIQRNRLGGSLPAAVLLLYLAANSIARTSGGRYIVPVDWILVCYFSVAAAELVHAGKAVLRRDPVPRLLPGLAGARPRIETPINPPRRRGLLRRRLQKLVPPSALLMSILLVGALVPVAGELYPRRYGLNGRESLLEQVQPQLDGIGNVKELEAFLVQPESTLVEGRLLYPLFYRKGQGEPTRYAPYTAQDYGRLVFILIGPEGIWHVILPGTAPAAIPNATDALVFGCRRREGSFNIIRAMAVVLPQQAVALTRDPVAPLNCPLPDPVCDSNGNCY